MSNEYPMTLDEFKKRVVELFLEGADSPEDLESRIYTLEHDGGNELLEGEYSYACYYYDDPQNPSNQFTDEGLIIQPVRILKMI